MHTAWHKVSYSRTAWHNTEERHGQKLHNFEIDWLS